MSNCITLIASVTEPDMAKWETVGHMHNILASARINNMCIIKDQIQGDDILFKDVDCRMVSAMVMHECTGAKNPHDEDLSLIHI